MVCKQGGVETPDEWNALLEWVMTPLVKAWTEKGYGAALDIEGKSRITHAHWLEFTRLGHMLQGRH